MIFDAEDLEELLIHGECDGYELIHQKLIGRTKSGLMRYDLVFRTQRKYFKVPYHLPIFSYGEAIQTRHMPFGGEVEVNCVEVLPVEATVIEYLPVKETRPVPRAPTVGFELPQ